MNIKRYKGFTLIELLVVFGLISIIALIAIPRINRSYGYLESYSKDLVYDIRYVRERTMSGKKGYKIKFGCDEDCYYYEMLIDKNNDGIHDSDAEESQVKKCLKKNYVIAPGAFNITFKADGILKTDAQIITINNKNEPTECVTITVNSLGNSFIE